jgi:AcrR family transcriptional regulator
MAVMANGTSRPRFQEAARELLRTTLLDAARELLRERSWSDITMADIAVAGGVSRQTLYKEFGSRDEFAQAFVLRDADRFLGAVEATIQAHRDDPEQALALAFDLFLRAAAEDPLVRAVVFEGDGELLRLVTTEGKPLVERAAERLAGAILGGWPQVARRDADLLAECLVRLGISYAALPSGPAGMTAASVTTLLGPYLRQVLDAAAA